ncbi:uncharacterized protein EV420DRAFT_1485922 [Desarmillaria tabescens]|uniref:Uncharacterized protein n=1 Tax=Armillaria tabescens TaxID=1929756 RepID=A0AA39JFM7_ARMTA|nr:uncharacterized protein EV420DRAFT_1485922 [Desarmillaria tabescens]KAK0440454.1 hypothetical protein EV420DRAFT_1485922 [Desarmillaria tabescens]
MTQASLHTMVPPSASNIPQKQKYNKNATAKLDIPVLKPYNYHDSSQYSLSSVNETTASVSVTSENSLILFQAPASPEDSPETASSSFLPIPSSAESLPGLSKAHRPYRRIPELVVPILPPYIQSLSAAVELRSIKVLDGGKLKTFIKKSIANAEFIRRIIEAQNSSLPSISDATLTHDPAVEDHDTGDTNLDRNELEDEQTSPDELDDSERQLRSRVYGAAYLDEDGEMVYGDVEGEDEFVDNERESDAEELNSVELGGTASKDESMWFSDDILDGDSDDDKPAYSFLPVWDSARYDAFERV